MTGSAAEVSFAGVCWDWSGYQLAVLDPEGRRHPSPAHYPAGRADELIEHLAHDVPRPCAVVIDSSCGVIDGRMMAAGLSVYRVDPAAGRAAWTGGYPSALELADAARLGLAGLTRLGRATGTQTGREAELEAGYQASAPALAELVRSGRCVEHGPRDRPYVALTFDDGPVPRYTEQILDVLAEFGARATFFCVGINVVAYQDCAARIVRDGHLLGNHTWSHPFLWELSRQQLSEQIVRTGEAIAELDGGAPPRYFRPPYGSRTSEVVTWLADSGLTTALWDVYPFDWTSPGAEVISDIVLRDARPGSVVLLHDGGGDRSETVAALPTIIRGLLDRGTALVRLDDL